MRQSLIQAHGAGASHQQGRYTKGIVSAVPPSSALLLDPKKKYVCAVCKSVCDLYGLFLHMKQVRLVRRTIIHCRPKWTKKLPEEIGALIRFGFIVTNINFYEKSHNN